jgi:hypothetical protein
MPHDLHAFLVGEGEDARGRTADDVIAMSDEELEAYHDWVQWLFPLPTASAAVPGSPVLTESDIAAIRADPQAIATLERASERLIQFYRRTDHWLARYDHNHLRISRVIQSLRLLVGPDAAQHFYEAVLERHEAAGAPVNENSLRYWREALSESRR